MSQIVKQFSYNSTLENWAFTAGGASSLTGTRDTTEDATNDTNPGTGVMQSRRTGKNKADGTPYWEWGNGTLAWTDLGVPAGATITAVNLNYDWKCSEYTTGANTSATGPAELRDGAGTTLRGTFSAALTFGATSNWATRSGTAITGLTDPANTTLRLRIGAKPNTGNSVSAAVTLRQDWVVVTITYFTTTSKSLSGTLSSDGAILKKISHTLIAVISPSGQIIKMTSIFPTGSIAFTGEVAFVRLYAELLSGIMNLSGKINKVTIFIKALSGIFISSGSLIKITTFLKSLSGTLDLAGETSKIATFLKQIGGAFDFTGGLSKKISKSVSGAISLLSFLANSYTLLHQGGGEMNLSGSLNKTLISGGPKHEEERLSATEGVHVI